MPDEVRINGRLLVQIASYNTNLQGNLGLPQDLVDWLSPTLQVSTFLSREPRAPDIVAVGFQELLPLSLGLCGLSKSVVNNRASHILSQIEFHAPKEEKYSLIAKVVNVGVALLVYARDDGLARKVKEVQTQWTGCGPTYMGNKGAVGVRFRVEGPGDTVGEVYTFVCAHLAAHEHQLEQRINDYQHIVDTLLFPSTPTSATPNPTTMYSTSHLFFFGDLNFRIALSKTHPIYSSLQGKDAAQVLDSEDTRERLKEYDQLFVEKKKQTALVGLREGEFWKFKCSYKYILGEVDRYSETRTPSWTDRILYTTYSDEPDLPQKSNITNILYTSVPSYTTSDHKPVVALFLLPTPQVTNSFQTPPLLNLPETFKPKPHKHATLMRYQGRAVDRIVGSIWWLFSLFGAGNALLGFTNTVLGIIAWVWLRRTKRAATVN